MRRFDYIIVGGGLSGITLLLHMLASPLRNKSIAIVEKEPRPLPYERIWTYWVERDHILSPAVTRRWKSLKIAGQEYETTRKLNTYTIEYIHSRDLFQYAKTVISKNKNVTVVRGDARAIYSHFARAGVTTKDGTTIEADWVFDSSSVQTPFMSDPFGIIGWTWEIRTAKSVFDPAAMTLFDFRNTPEPFSFFYLLPFSDHKATLTLAQYGHRHEAVPDPQIYATEFLTRVLKAGSPHLSDISYGFIPLIGKPAARNTEHRIMPIGSTAGLVNPLTSYTMNAILADSERIVHALVTTGRPFHTGRPPGFGPVNAALKRIMQTDPGQARRIFLDLFRLNNEPDPVLSFISQEKPFMHYFDLVRKMNPVPIMKAMAGL